MEVIGKNYAFQKFGEKVLGEVSAIRGMITVEYEFNKIVRPRNLYAKVVIFASNSEDFHFKSEAVWKSEDYSKIVLDGLLDVLVNKNPMPILKGSFILKEIGWDDIGSCESAFYSASVTATIGILRETGYSDLF
jgi:hypothetical protein